jgi:hypothetical protein
MVHGSNQIRSILFIELDEEQMKQADKSELVNRGYAMAKIIKYWHYGSDTVEAHEAVDMLDRGN